MLKGPKFVLLQRFPGSSGGGGGSGSGVSSFNGRSGDVVLFSSDITGAGGVPSARKIIAGAGLSGGGDLSQDRTLSALIVSVFGRTGSIVAQAGDYDVSQITNAVPNTRRVIAGSGLSGGGFLSADVTLNANVLSVNGQTGAVNLTAANVGAPPTSLQIIAGSGLNGGGALVGNVTLNANVISVFGRAGDVTLQSSDIQAGGGVTQARRIIAGTGLSGGGTLAADVTLNMIPLTSSDLVAMGGVPSTRQIVAGTGISGGGDLSQDRTISVTPKSTNQLFDISINSGANITTPALNLISGDGVTILATYNAGTSQLDVTLSSYGGSGGGGAVTSVFGRTGAIVATPGDYPVSYITNALDATQSYDNPPWLNSLDWGKIVNEPTTFPPMAHTHNAQDIIAGVIDPARLGTGTANTSTYLRGDGTWAVISGGGGSQTPWTQDIDARGYTLYGLGQVLFGTDYTYDIGAYTGNRPRYVWANRIAINMDATPGTAIDANGGIRTSNVVGNFMGNSGVLDYVAPNTRISSYGSGVGTIGSFQLRQVTSDGSTSRVAFSFSSTPANEMTLPGTRPGILLDQGLNARSRAFQANVGPRFDIADNAWYDGANWQRDDTTQASSLFTLNPSNATFRYTALGTGAITWATPFTFDFVNNVETISGTRPTLLFDQGVASRSRIQQAVASARLDIVANGYFDGSAWQRDDTAQTTTLLSMQSSSSGSVVNIGYAPTGANPASIQNRFQFDPYNDVFTVGMGGARPTILLDQGATARVRVTAAVTSPYIYLTSNCYYDGTNFLRDDVAQAASFFRLDPAQARYYYAPAGSNPMTVANPFLFDLASGNFSATGVVKVGSGYAATAGDIGVARTSAPTTGAIFFNNDGSKYLYYDGSKFNFNANLTASALGIGTAPSNALDVVGDMNMTGVLRLSGSPCATPSVRQDVTASRAATTVYQNTTGRVLWVSVTWQVTAGSSLTLFCDSTSAPTQVLCANISYYASAITVAGWVPPNWYYKVTTNGTKQSWFEWY